MAVYKISYTVLHQQGDEIKAAAKLVDGYIERVGQISARLGEGDLLATVRANLQKLQAQLAESRTVLNTAGELLTQSVENYAGVEARGVKKVDGTKAHNRDFYKNPVVVASAGGAAAGAGGVATATTINYTDNSVNINTAAEPVAAAATPVAAATDSATVVTPMSATAAGAAPAGAGISAGGVAAGAAAAAGAGALSGAVGTGAVMGATHLSKKRAAKKAAETEADAEPPADEARYDPEAELEKALQRVRDLEEEPT